MLFNALLSILNKYKHSNEPIQYHLNMSCKDITANNMQVKRMNEIIIQFVLNGIDMIVYTIQSESSLCHASMK